MLAEATEGILVTKDQVAAIEAAERGGRTLEIDIDQDNGVPGTNANAALGFARDMPDGDPLPRKGSATSAAAAEAEAITPAAPTAAEENASIVLAPATGERTIPAALEPEMSDLNRM